MKLAYIKDPVCYLSAEFGIDNELPTYSGGLGVLTGDIINQAASENYPMVGLGILYKGKNFIQHITGLGKAETRDSEFDHDTSFLRTTTVDGKPVIVEMDLGKTNIKAKSYHIRLSDHTILFFLSTDVDGNPPEWITDMDTLYGGDMDSQIRQQILLGVGGLRLLKALDISPRLYHINEGRPEFIIWELVSDIIKRGTKSFEEAWQEARQKIVYTNHTLVAASNITYPRQVLEKWARIFAENLGVDSSSLINDGLIDESTFSTTLFAINISSKQSAVSKVHAKYAKSQWPNYEWIPITNGVNMMRWQDSDFRNPSLSDSEIWEQHLIKKKELASSVLKRTGFEYDYKRLTIVWARRLAEYKQPTAIFKDIGRLKKILSNPERPIQILFAGNSHSGDANAKQIIEDIIKLFASDLAGYAIFVPNYNISLANHMTSGSDVWLNTPKGNLEACGTSGMKALANGVINCTVLDGWTYEVDWEKIGWTLDPNNVADNFYDLLEYEIAPLYYKRNENGLPLEWIERMRKSIALAPRFSTERVFKEYKEKLYA